MVPTCPEVPLTEFAIRLAASLSDFGPTLHLNSKLLDGLLGISDMAQKSEDDIYDIRLTDWLNEQEARHRFIIYETDGDVSSWTKRCLRQADRILLLAQASSTPAAGEIETRLLHKNSGMTSARRSLVLLHPHGNRLPCGSKQWLDIRQVENHYHVRWDTEADFSRLARFLTHSAVGVALSGGGARGFAHIGVIRALEEAGIPIDMIGGTSMGAVISSQYSLGWDVETMIRLNKKEFAEVKPFREYTLPIISMIRSRRLEYLIKKHCGDIQIEDLWMNFFCVSSNLSTAQAVIHQEGPLWKAIRASVSLPGILAPVIYGNNLLIDGGVLNNLPGDIMRELCGGVVIAVDVGTDEDLTVSCQNIPSPWHLLWNRVVPFKEKVNVPTIIDIIMRSTVLNSIHKKSAVKMEADLYLRPPVDRFKMLDFQAIDKIAKAGYLYSKEKVTDWKKHYFQGNSIFPTKEEHRHSV